MLEPKSQSRTQLLQRKLEENMNKVLSSFSKNPSSPEKYSLRPQSTITQQSPQIRSYNGSEYFHLPSKSRYGTKNAKNFIKQNRFKLRMFKDNFD